MPVKVLHDDGDIISVHVTGKLSATDYGQFVPQVEQIIRDHGKVRILLVMKDFHGWEAAALWEDVKFDVKHFSDIKKLAMVGDSRWERGMAAFCKPFTTAKVRFFDSAHEAEAANWLSED